MTYKKYVEEMIEYAKEIQGDNYPGDDYYSQDCWRENWEDGVSPLDAVYKDMGYWE